MTSPSRRSTIGSLAATAAAAALLTLPGAAIAQDAAYPSKPVRFVTWSSPGGTIDVVTRLMAENLSKRWSQPITVDNRVGASGMLATEHVARAAPDGYTILFTTPTAQLYNPLLRTKVPYDPVKDFQPLSLLVTGPMALTAAKGAPFSTMQELLAHARGGSSRLTYGTWGIGSGAHLLGEQLKAQTQLDWVQVPYKNGESGILVDVVGGSIDVGFMGGGSAKNHAASGKVKILGVTGTSRTAHLPDVPTFAEQGLTGMEFGGWIAAYAPAGTPRAVVDKLVAGLQDVMREPAIAKRLDELTYDVVGSTPEALQKFNEQETGQWRALIQRANIRIE